MSSHNRKVALATIETILELSVQEKLIFTYTLWLCSIPWLRRHFMSRFKEKESSDD